MLGRSAPQADVELAFTHAEIELLERLVSDTPQNAQAPPMARNVIRLAQLGGYLVRASDPPPGNTMMWCGMRHLTDIRIGYELALKRCG
ncbi:IS4 family transposase [Paraburkholderia solisilvae]